MQNRLLLLFLKAPAAGEVKTRLAATVGGEAARAIYRELVSIVLRQIEGVERVELRFTPDDAGVEVRPWLRPGWRAKAQGDGDLGVRLQRAFAEAFHDGHDAVIAIGSDCPEITAQDLADAWETLRGCDVVLGPAVDGGYWLIGCRSFCPELFQGIAWSTAGVLEQTLARCRDAGRSLRLLRLLADVDTEADWKRFGLLRGARADAGNAAER